MEKIFDNALENAILRNNSVWRILSLFTAIEPNRKTWFYVRCWWCSWTSGKWFGIEKKNTRFIVPKLTAILNRCKISDRNAMYVPTSRVQWPHRKLQLVPCVTVRFSVMVNSQGMNSATYSFISSIIQLEKWEFANQRNAGIKYVLFIS